MKVFFLRTTLVAALALGPAAANAETNAEVDAHRTVLDLAGAFTNDGFKLRDGDYTGTLKPGEAAVIQVNLYAGNEYWFSVATADPKTAVSINVYDETGKLVKTDAFTTAADTSSEGPAEKLDPDANSNRSAAGFAPDASGPYYLRIANTAGSEATYCLIYSYK